MTLIEKSYQNNVGTSLRKAFPKISITLIFLICFGLLSISIFWLLVIPAFSHYIKARELLSSIFEGAYLNGDIKFNLLTETHFLWLGQYSTYLLIAVICLGVALLVSVISLFKRSKSVIVVFDNHTGFIDWKILAAIFLCWIVLKVFLYHYLPLHIDEVFDFLYYSKQSFILRQSYIFNDGEAWFNNHILYTHCSAIFHFIGFSDKLAIRLPSILSEFLLFSYLIHVLKKQKVIYFLLIGLLSSFWLGIYSVEGRSYYMTGMCFIVLIMESYRFYKSPEIKYITYFVLFAICGLATSKLFILPLVGALFIQFIVISIKKALIIESILGLILIGIGGISSYLPAFVLGGSTTFFETIGKPTNLTALFPLFLQNLSVITGLNSRSYLGVLFLFLLAIVFFKKLSVLSKFLFCQLLVQYAVLFLFIILSHDYLPFRAVIYLSALFSITLLSIIYDLVLEFQLKWKPSLAILGLVLMSHTMYLYQNTWLKNCKQFIFDKVYYTQLAENIEKISAQSPNTVYVEKGNNSYLFYLKLTLGEQILTEDTTHKNLADIIISKEKVSHKKLLFYDDKNDLFIYQNNHED